MKTPPSKPLSERPGGGGSAIGCLALFFLVFFLAGAAALYFMVLRPARGLLASRSWVETPCQVEASRVGESSSSDGTTYRVEVDYAYSFQGREYRSSRYDFLDFYSSGYDGKAAVVARYPPGTRTLCYVNPEAPAEAVINRGLSWGWLAGLVPLLFIAVGGGGLLAVIWSVFKGKKDPARLRKARAALGVTTLAREPAPRELASGPVTLRAKATPFGTLVVMIVLALFWNGITSVFLWKVVEGWQTGNGDGCLTAFLVPFVLVGLALIYGIFRQFLILFNPRPTLIVERDRLAPGESVLLQWRFRGRTGRVSRFRILLEGWEEASYRQGTDTRTERKLFHASALVDASQPTAIPAGTASLGIPAGSVPSFKSDHNKIIWSLKVQTEIPGWPDSEEEYELQVEPAAPGGFR
ncbi:MAG TPA: DUF3592 domain-containing protein [Thermoanaerobaculia bacterium]|nr:DUF3592 domain-containing protein [Thermoanaerobaculia bacterium]